VCKGPRSDQVPSALERASSASGFARSAPRVTFPDTPMPKRAAAPTEDWRALSRAVEATLDTTDFVKACELAERAVRAADASTEAPAASRDRAAAGAMADPESPARASTRRLLALSLLYADRAEDAMRVALEAVRVAHAARARREEAEAELVATEVARAQGQYLEALKHAARARSLAQQSGDLPTLRSALGQYAVMLSRVGDAERARDLFDEALALPEEGQPAVDIYRVLHGASTAHRTAGRYTEALAVLDKCEELAKRAGLHAVRGSIVGGRAFVYAEIGAYDVARKLIAEHAPLPSTPGWQRAKLLTLQATIAQAAGERPEVVDRLACEGLAIERLEPTTRMTLEHLRAQALMASGRVEEAERLAIGLAVMAAKLGAHSVGAHALALAARAGHPDAWLLRWLGAGSLAIRGVAARVDHAANAALVNEPEPIGSYARTMLEIVRERLVENTPPEHRATMRRTLRQVEARLAALRKAGREHLETALDDEVLRAKDEVGLVGGSPGLLRAIATLARAAKTDASVVITGETGSGKELFARLAHRLSDRASGPFVALNCAAIPQNLLEAELFGHERGAFTGADRARAGLFVEAEGGTLLLDELGEMSPAMQAKLLRVLEDRTVRPVGGSRARKVNVRVVAATHRDLAALVASGAFREDLYYRLAAITVRVPSLRERPEDIPTIARALLARDPATKNHRLDVPGLAALAEHTWPGNVRELANALRVAGAMVEGTVIGRPELTQAVGARPLVGAGQHAEKAIEETTLAALRARHRSELRELVGRAIAGADGNKRQAARALGVSRQGLYRVLGT
jgi:DNA-binding NtrC family response regulator